ncbi:hypothetical protein RND61_02765 [Streptomyces sp. TRM76323]|uniref:Uncharacterized protein n=1 Tax=Streptomyces tamarix TaxID=3078565 RepID=A0ABU3QEC1_9ACTN|nr:hypothetical protein [Streptomyces tamarix]MDT9681011.1 hypothetical protein [Streptomyces tamarix]
MANWTLVDGDWELVPNKSGATRLIRDHTLEGHESAHRRGKTIGGADVTDDSMLSMALHLRDQEMSLRDSPTFSAAWPPP